MAQNRDRARRRHRASFPADATFHLLEIGIQAIQLSPYHAGPTAPRLQRLSAAAASMACCCPVHLSDPGKPSDPGTSLRVPPGSAGDTTRRLMAHCHRSASSRYSPVCSSMRHRGRPRRCSSMPRCATGAGACSSTGSAAAANASCATGQEIPACRAASAGVIPRSLTSAPACSRSRAVRRHRGGTCGSDSVNVFRAHRSSRHFQRHLTQQAAHGVAGPPDIPRPGQHGVMPAGRDRLAVRARRRGRVIRDRPYLQRAVRPGLHIGDLQALHAEQHRRRILEHDARGFLMILILW